jgi:hypothetical protein
MGNSAPATTQLLIRIAHLSSRSLSLESAAQSHEAYDAYDDRRVPRTERRLFSNPFLLSGAAVTGAAKRSGCRGVGPSLSNKSKGIPKVQLLVLALVPIGHQLRD